MLLNLYHDIKTDSSVRSASGGGTSITTLNRKSSAGARPVATVSEQSLPVIGVFRGVKVAVRSVRKAAVVLLREDLVELKAVSDFWLNSCIVLLKVA